MPLAPPSLRPASLPLRAFLALGHALLVALALTGCGAGDGLVLPGDGEPSTIRVMNGNLQSGRVGEELADPLTVKVTDSRGHPVAGADVAFELTDAGPGAEVTPATATTDSKGEADTRIRLGTRMGAQTGEARLVLPDGNQEPKVSFTATALSENANGIAAVSGQDQSGPAGSTLAQPLVVEVTDAFGNPISGIPVDWAVEGGGSVSAASVSTDDQGRASVQRQLGPTAGEQKTIASSAGLAGSPVTFTHTATAGNAAGLTIVTGNNQSAEVGTRVPVDPVVQLTDADGNPVPGAPVTWVVSIGGGTVSPENGVTGADGRASAGWTLGPAPGENRLDAVVSGVGIASFAATGRSSAPSATITTITSDSPDPSVAGSTVTVEFQVTGNSGTPTGSVTVTVSGGTPTCSATLSGGRGSCQLTLGIVGDRILTASYSGATGFARSSDTEPHRVTPVVPGNRAPDADFNWHCDDLTCQFTDASSDRDGRVVSWRWDFGDGSSSTLREPTHTYAAPGTYEVKLTVTDDDGASDDATAHVDVHGPPPPPENKAPHAEFEVSCPNQDLTCTFADRSHDDDGNIVAWHWDFGDGQTADNVANPSHTYAAAQTYHVTLTVTDNGGASDSKTHDANPKAPPPPPENKAPQAEFEVSCPNQDLTCNFTDKSKDDDGSVTAWHWDFGDGQTSDIQNPSHTYATAQTYSVTLTVTDNGGATNSKTHDADPKAPPPPNQPPTAAFTFTCDALSCSFNSDGSTDADGNIVSWQWDFGDGSASSDRNPSHTYAAGGTFNVTLTVTDNDAASNSVTQQVAVTAPNQPPTAAFTWSCSGLTCAFDSSASTDDGGIVAWDWDFSDHGEGSDQPNPSHTFEESGPHEVRLRVMDAAGAEGEIRQDVVVPGS